MSGDPQLPVEPHLPSLGDLGHDLLSVSVCRRVVTLATPFAWMAAYFGFAALGWWPLAIISVMGLSFSSYGSTSHDLVHRTLHLPPRANQFFLVLIELLSFRSGTAYRLSHLHHHRHLLEPDDIEGAAAHGSLAHAILSGITLQFRLWLWALRTHRSARLALLGEAVGISVLAIGSVAAVRFSLIPLVYVGLVVAGSWSFPLVTVYLPHDVDGRGLLDRTRLFRGWFVRLVAFDHLYHLEHHLYPAVPHHHWKALADRLDPHFERASVRPWPHPPETATPRPVTSASDRLRSEATA
jgi:beta-carotene hydroxylase